MPREQLPPQHHAATHTRAQSEQHHITEALRRTTPGFPHQGTIAVVGQGDATLKPSLKPVGQRHVVPTRQVDAHPGHPGRGVHGPGQTHPDQPGQAHGIQPINRFTESHRHSTGHRWLRGVDRQLGLERTLTIETGQLDRRSAEIDSDHLLAVR